MWRRKCTKPSPLLLSLPPQKYIGLASSRGSELWFFWVFTWRGYLDKAVSLSPDFCISLILVAMVEFLLYNMAQVRGSRKNVQTSSSVFFNFYLKPCSDPYTIVLWPHAKTAPTNTSSRTADQFSGLWTQEQHEKQDLKKSVCVSTLCPELKPQNRTRNTVAGHQCYLRNGLLLRCVLSLEKLFTFYFVSCDSVFPSWLAQVVSTCMRKPDVCIEMGRVQNADISIADTID